MKSNYNQLGQYIEMVSRTNSDLKYGIEDVRGCSNTKQMMQTRANLIGRTYEKFIVLRPQEFVFNRRTTRNGEKIGMAYNNTDREYIFTNDYVAFRVKQEYFDKLLPDYLYMFFCRDEFDRYARYKSTGSATEFFNWEDMCAVPFEIPPMDFQQLVVNAYKVLNERIETKQKINDNLEATAFAIYRETFITSRSANWNKGTLSDLLAVKYGKDHKHLADGTIPLYGSGGIMRYVEKSLYDKVSVLIPRKGTLSNVLYVDEPFWSVDTMFYTEISKPYAAKFIYYFVKSKDLSGMDTGSAVPSMSSEIIHSMELNIPDDETLISFDKCLCPLYKQIKINNQECDKLKSLQGILLTTISSH